MSYVKQTWSSGNKITAEKLNHIEDGVAATAIVVTGTTAENTTTLDTTWQDINDAFAAGSNVVVTTSAGLFSVVSVETDTTDYSVYVLIGGVATAFVASASSGYPAYTST